MERTTANPAVKKKTAFKSWRKMVERDFSMNKGMYLLASAGIAFYIVFYFAPMYGLIISFKDYVPSLGIMGSPWVGFEHFKDFFQSIYFSRVTRNTILLNFYGLLVGFPLPIIFALLLNELRAQKFKGLIQTISYLPYFISTVVICGMIVEFTSEDGIITNILNLFGGNHSSLLLNAKFFRPIYIISDTWQGMGWASIIYLAALSNVDVQLYEAARIDGAKKFKQMLHVTLPGISTTIIIMFILKVGNMMSLGADKVILLYNPSIYETSDVISSFVYRRGLVDGSFGFSTAVGLFNSLINCVLVFTANYISGKVNDVSLF